MINEAKLFRGQGKLKIARWLPNGKLSGFRWVGGASELMLEPTTENIEHEESYTGMGLTDAIIPVKNGLNVSFSLEQFSYENLELAFYGDTTTDEGTGTFTFTLEEAEVGLDYKFGGVGYGITAVTDASAEPVTVSNSNYRVNTDGTVAFTNLTGLTFPLTITGPKAKSTKTRLMSKTSPNVALLFEGLNTADNNTPVIVMLDKIQLQPASGGFGLISKELATIKLSGKAMYVFNSTGNVIPGFGSIDLAVQAGA